MTYVPRVSEAMSFSVQACKQKIRKIVVFGDYNLQRKNQNSDFSNFSLSIAL